MDPNDFHCEKAGSVEWSDNGQFCYFRPNTPPFDTSDNDLLGRSFHTVSMISKLDGRISNLPDKERYVILNSFAIKEATTSSAIEGSQSTVSDIFRSEKEKETDPERDADNQEVRNYRSALEYGIRTISESGAITTELILSMHDILLKDVRGKNKQPGEYRNSQVWVGSRRDSVETAQYVPTPPFAIPYLMDDLLDYMNSGVGDPIQRIALAHYQFETIHPFMDGNGRMGRLIIMLLLYKERIMENPFLYLSEYFNRYRDEYIERLMKVRTDCEFREWIEFLLNAIDSQVRRASTLMDSLGSYRDMLTEFTFSMGSGELNIVCGMIMENPYITASDVVKRVGVSAPTARKLLGMLVTKGILEEAPGKRKGTLYVANDILDMLDEI